MSDIVERLRAQAAGGPTTLALDAAVEVERLRSQIATVVAAERAAIVAMIEECANEQLVVGRRAADLIDANYLVQSQPESVSCTRRCWRSSLEQRTEGTQACP
jgi:hypothetical protein